jgi:hypothetical protein
MSKGVHFHAAGMRAKWALFSFYNAITSGHKEGMEEWKHEN